MSDTDNTRPPKFGGRCAFSESRRVRGPNPETMSVKGHPRESWAEERKAEWRKARRADKQNLVDDGPPPEHRQLDVHYDRW